MKEVFMDTLNIKYRKILIMHQNNSLSLRHPRLCSIGNCEVRTLDGCPSARATKILNVIQNGMGVVCTMKVIVNASGSTRKEKPMDNLLDCGRGVRRTVCTRPFR